MTVQTILYPQRVLPLAPPVVAGAPMAWMAADPPLPKRSRNLALVADGAPWWAGQIFSITPQGWQAEQAVLFKRPLQPALQQFETLPRQAIFSITPQGWWSVAPERVQRKPFPANAQMDNALPVQQVSTLFVASAWVTAWDGPARSPFPARAQQVLADTPQQVPSPVTPQGYDAISPILYAKRLTPGLVRDVQQPDAVYQAAAVTYPEGWRSEMPAPAAARRPGPIDAAPVLTQVATPSAAWVAGDIVLPRRSRAQTQDGLPAQQVPTLFVPEAWISAWDGPPRQRFPAGLQRADQPVLAAYTSVVITYPDGWQTAAEPPRARRAPAMDAAPVTLSVPTIAYQAWGAGDPLVRRPRADQPAAMLAVPPAVTPPPNGFTVSFPEPVRIRLRVPDLANGPFPAASSPVSGFAAVDGGLPPKPARRPPAEPLWPVQPPAAVAHPGNADLWSYVDFRFRTIRPPPPDLMRVIIRTGFRIVGQPTLLGTSTSPTMIGTDAPPALYGTSTSAKLLGDL